MSHEQNFSNSLINASIRKISEMNPKDVITEEASPKNKYVAYIDSDSPFAWGNVEAGWYVSLEQDAPFDDDYEGGDTEGPFDTEEKAIKYADAMISHHWKK